MIRLIIETVTRAMAAILFLSGFGAAIFVSNSAQDLYNNPENIEQFAERIELATGLDRKIGTLLKGTLEKDDAADDDNAETAESPDALVADAAEDSHAPVRLSYFVAWILVILLLSLLIRISLAMVHTGGLLVLHDLRAHRSSAKEEKKKK